MMNNTFKTRLTKSQILEYLAEREAEAWKSYKMFKDDSPTVAEIFRQEWNQTYRIINDLKAAKR
jgi:hypothetical protein